MRHVFLFLATCLAGATLVRAQLTVGPNVNVSRLAGNQSEAAVAINPTNPNNVVIVSNIAGGGALFRGFSTDGGATWTSGLIANGGALGLACCDGSLSFDSFGNLFLTYINSAVNAVQLARSTDGGSTFTFVATMQTGSIDQPTVTTGAGAVWVTWRGPSGLIEARGAPVTGLGAVGAFTAVQSAPGSTGNFGDIAIGPAGQVMVTYQIPSGGQGPANIFANVDPDGLGAAGFGAQILATATNVGGFDFIPAQSVRSVDAEAGLAWDRTGGAHNGRVYLVYTDEFPDESNDMDIFVRFSDNNGATWSPRVRVNNDATTRSQFLPRIALDQTSGNIAVSWHDARNSAGNNTSQFFGSVSFDFGATFLANVQISAGTSNALPALNGIDYGDYTGLAFQSRRIHPAWADNSNSTGDNPAGALSTFDIYTERLVVNRAPVAACKNVTVSAGASCTASASINNGSSDPDGDPITITQTPPGPYALGPTLVTLHVTDSFGATSTCTGTVTVTDTTPPVVTSSVGTSLLWPPNHDLEIVGLAASATDNCTAHPTLAVRGIFSTEADIGPGSDANFSPDAANIGLGTLRLRSERDDGTGRVYLNVVRATDAAGNVAFSCTAVAVPDSQSPPAVAAANAAAAAAQAFCNAHNGVVPPGYVPVGVGPIVGPKQ